MPLTLDSTAKVEPDPQAWPDVPATTFRLRLYEWAGERQPVAIVGSLAGNPGLDVWQAIEYIWVAVSHLLESRQFTLVEHYGPDAHAIDGVRSRERFEVVTFDTIGVPSWRLIDRVELKALTGETGWL